MGARRKLNSAYFNGCLVVAGLLGWLTESWTAFLVALVVLVGTAWNCGDIRPGQRGGQKKD